MLLNKITILSLFFSVSVFSLDKDKFISNKIKKCNQLNVFIDYERGVISTKIEDFFNKEDYYSRNKETNFKKNILFALKTYEGYLECIEGLTQINEVNIKINSNYDIKKNEEKYLNFEEIFSKKIIIPIYYDQLKIPIRRNINRICVRNLDRICIYSDKKPSVEELKKEIYSVKIMLKEVARPEISSISFKFNFFDTNKKKIEKIYEKRFYSNIKEITKINSFYDACFHFKK